MPPKKEEKEKDKDKGDKEKSDKNDGKDKDASHIDPAAASAAVDQSVIRDLVAELRAMRADQTSLSKVVEGLQSKLAAFPPSKDAVAAAEADAKSKEKQQAEREKEKDKKEKDADSRADAESANKGKDGDSDGKRKHGRNGQGAKDGDSTHKEKHSENKHRANRDDHKLTKSQRKRAQRKRKLAGLGLAKAMLGAGDKADTTERPGGGSEDEDSTSEHDSDSDASLADRVAKESGAGSDKDSDSGSDSDASSTGSERGKSRGARKKRHPRAQLPPMVTPKVNSRPIPAWVWDLRHCRTPRDASSDRDFYLPRMTEQAYRRYGSIAAWVKANITVKAGDDRSERNFHEAMVLATSLDFMMGADYIMGAEALMRRMWALFKYTQTGKVSYLKALAFVDGDEMPVSPEAHANTERKVNRLEKEREKQRWKQPRGPSSSYDRRSFGRGHGFTGSAADAGKATAESKAAPSSKGGGRGRS